MDKLSPNCLAYWTYIQLIQHDLYDSQVISRLLTISKGNHLNSYNKSQLFVFLTEHSRINHHVVSMFELINQLILDFQLRGDEDFANTFSIFLYNTINDALEMNLTSNFTVLEGYCIRIIHYGNGNQECQQILLKPNSKFT